MIDEKPWAALMAWALDDVVARRIRSRDEKTVKLSGEYLVAMEVLVKSLRVFHIRASFLKCEAWVMGPLHRSHRTLDGIRENVINFAYVSVLSARLGPLHRSHRTLVGIRENGINFAYVSVLSARLGPKLKIPIW